MGNPGDGSKRAWQLDFRCAAVRKRTGGTGVVLLSATPAKNSPLEFYNLIQYVDPEAWRRMGIRDPEQFIDRYLRIEIKPVVTPTMEVEERGAVVGFQNLHELRDTILRYGEFKTAEDVGLKLPEPKVEMVEVDMDAGQDAKYDRYVREIEAALKSDDPSQKAKILGLLARMALVAVHAQLDEGYGWKNADQVSDPSSPKFEALAERVLANRTCGHIVFVDNVAAHRWVKMTLVNAGIAADRIGVMNAEVAPNAADRQRIAKEFNGEPESETKPKFDVVIAGGGVRAAGRGCRCGRWWRAAPPRARSRGACCVRRARRRRRARARTGGSARRRRRGRGRSRARGAAQARFAGRKGWIAGQDGLADAGPEGVG